MTERDTLPSTFRDNETVERKSNGADPDFDRLAAIWPTLSTADRAALLTLAQSLERKPE